MNLADAIITALYHSREYCSGENLAQGFGVTRAAVSQRVAELKAAGWPIEAVPRCGYRLRVVPDILSGAVVQSLLALGDVDCPVLYFPTIDSTNSFARESLGRLPSLCLIMANEQTAGRGRFDRSFHSPANSGVYMSLVIREPLDARSSALLTCAAAVAVRRGIISCGGPAVAIKWVNDLFLKGRKVAGILTESSVDMESGTLSNTVIGMGLNVHPVDLPPALQPVVGSLGMDGCVMERNRLAAAIVLELVHLIRALPDAAFMDDYRSASLVLGQRVTVQRWHETAAGSAEAIDSLGQLLLRLDDGSTMVCNSGEVSLRLVGQSR